MSDGAGVSCPWCRVRGRIETEHAQVLVDLATATAQQWPLLRKQLAAVEWFAAVLDEEGRR
jgi:hypothetical protein